MYATIGFANETSQGPFVWLQVPGLYLLPNTLLWYRPVYTQGA